MEKDLIRQLNVNVKKDVNAVGIEKLKKELEKLKAASQAPDFWDDNIGATKIMQKIAQIEQKIDHWQSLQKDVDELLELSELDDQTLAKEIEIQYNKLEKKFIEMHTELSYSGPYDEYNALLDIHAGAGGTDAQDWAQMMLRMYLRWAEQNGYKTRVLEESAGEEAGLKSVSVEISGPLAFGKLKGEHGVHRLVRLSPFNAQNLRQTSFTKVEVLPEIDEPEAIPIDERDLKIDVFRAGGHGGQSVNTTDSAVRVTHIPTGIVVSIQNERSQIQNKETAMTILRSKLASLQLEQHAEKISELKGPIKSAEWGNQIRSYVLHPYNMVKDLRTNHETSNTQAVLDGSINEFIAAYATYSIK